jgi:large subunit ribosomal protein L6
MSRVAKAPITIPKGVDVRVEGQHLAVKGSKGAAAHVVPGSVVVRVSDGVVSFSVAEGAQGAVALAGTTRALVANMVRGVSEGFERRLQLVGVGYRAQMKGASLNLTLGHSHPIEFKVPEGISVETPSQTEIVVRGTDRQRVGQVAAKIRGLRPPEPYKGKGVKYADEIIVRKEAKKK